MNKINPLYIIGLLLFLLLLLVYKNSTMQNKLQSQQLSNKQTLSQAKELNSLKKAFKSKKRNQTTFESILNHPHLSKYSAQKDTSKSRMSVNLENLNKKAFDTLSSKLFNSTLKIDSFIYNRMNEHNISVEIGVLLWD